MASAQQGGIGPADNPPPVANAINRTTTIINAIQTAATELSRPNRKVEVPLERIRAATEANGDVFYFPILRDHAVHEWRTNCAKTESGVLVDMYELLNSLKSQYPLIWVEALDEYRQVAPQDAAGVEQFMDTFERYNAKDALDEMEEAREKSKKKGKGRKAKKQPKKKPAYRDMPSRLEAFYLFFRVNHSHMDELNHVHLFPFSYTQAPTHLFFMAYFLMLRDTKEKPINMPTMVKTYLEVRTGIRYQKLQEQPAVVEKKIRDLAASLTYTSASTPPPAPTPPPPAPPAPSHPVHGHDLRQRLPHAQSGGGPVQMLRRGRQHPYTRPAAGGPNNR